MEPNQRSDVERLNAYLRGLPPQRVIVRAVRELRSRLGDDGKTILVARVTEVEVVTVRDRSRVCEVFTGITGTVAAAAARGAGHDVIEQDGNIT